MSFYKYVSKYALDKILEGSIRLTQPGAFNDPFELAIETYNPYEKDNENLQLNFNVLSPQRDISKYLLESDFEDDNCNDLFMRDLIGKLNSSVGMLCLTKNEASHLMWAHYAEEYSGAVIEFDEAHDFFQGCYEVKYVEQRPKFHIDYFMKEKETPLSELYLKSTEWSYEKEWRLARNLLDCGKIKATKGNMDIYTLKLPMDCIKSITLGERTPMEVVKKVYHKVKNTNIALSIAVLANWKYEFRKEFIKYDCPISEMGPLLSPVTAEIFINDKGDFGDIARWTVKNHPMAKVTKARLNFYSK